MSMPETGNHGDGLEQIVALGLATYRQLDYWASAGYLGLQVPNPGSGNRRRITDGQIRAALTMAVLVNRLGMAPQVASRLVDGP